MPQQKLNLSNSPPFARQSFAAVRFGPLRPCENNPESVAIRRDGGFGKRRGTPIE
jgi:hypothetical protein